MLLQSIVQNYLTADFLLFLLLESRKKEDFELHELCPLFKVYSSLTAYQLPHKLALLESEGAYTRI